MQPAIGFQVTSGLSILDCAICVTTSRVRGSPYPVIETLRLLTVVDSNLTTLEEFSQNRLSLVGKKAFLVKRLGRHLDLS